MSIIINYTSSLPCINILLLESPQPTADSRFDPSDREGNGSVGADEDSTVHKCNATFWHVSILGCISTMLASTVLWRIGLGSPKATEIAERSSVRHLWFRTSSIAKRSSGI